MVIASLMEANTFFLIMKQISLCQALSYSTGMAGFVAVLTERSLLLLSGLDEDLQLSPRAREVLPFSFEMKTGKG